MYGRHLLLLTMSVGLAAAAVAQGPQNPSPMRETARRHERLLRGEDPGVRLTVDSILPTTVDLFVPARAVRRARVPLLIHIMGAPWLPARAIGSMSTPLMVASIHLGGGSATNADPFVTDSLRFERLLTAIERRLATDSTLPRLGPIYLSAWSAGYGAVRAIVQRPRDLDRLQGILLLDGCHTSYLPERTPVADGGVLDTTGLLPFLRLAQRAESGRLRFVMTHSEVFPGTFASTTECADWLVERMAMRRTPVLEWGPMGMQLVSRARAGGFEVLGFAGNSAPDHLDHLHGLGGFVPLVLRPR